MVKAYLRYQLKDAFGVVASTNSNCLFDHTGQLALTGCNENVVVWNLRQGVMMQQLRGDKSEVTIMALRENVPHVAVGYNDGSIKVWDFQSATCVMTLNGHKSAVTALRYNTRGTLLISGSKDTDIIVWDTIGESGLYRLRGHRDAVTDVRLLEGKENEKDVNGEMIVKRGVRLVSSSKDSLVKLWDLDTQHCTQTLVGHRAEVWTFDVDPQEQRLLTGSVDNQIRIWTLGAESTSEPGAMQDKEEYAKLFGSVSRPGRERAVTLRYHQRGTVFACQNADKTIDLFRVHSEEEVKKKIRRRKRRLREKAQQTMQVDGQPAAEEETVEVQPADEFSFLVTLRASDKIRSFDFAPSPHPNPASVQLLVVQHDNSIHVYNVPLEKHKASEYSKVSSVELPGHRTAVRAVALSSDDSMLVSASGETVKIWNTRTRHCIRSVDTGYGLTVAFVPGNRYAVLGTKEGLLQILDTNSSTVVESVTAHNGPIWSLCVRPDGKGLVSGSADHDVKFWDFELVESKETDSITASKRLTLSLSRTLTMSDDVLCVRLSPNGKLLAVSLLDTTVKVFYEDTLKFFLSLYGHKLPVMSIDISSDNTLLVSASADKNVKLWGLDFGDCHKSIFAHNNTIMGVQFVPKTHYFFTVGRDKMLKYWDGDKYEEVMTLEGHHSEIWCLAVSTVGDFVVTASQDNSLRIWEQTDEQLFLQEEREKKMEERLEEGIDKELGTPAIGDKEGESALAGKKTVETVKAGERLMEALDVAMQEAIRWEEYERDVKRAVEAERERQRVQPKAKKTKKTGEKGEIDMLEMSQQRGAEKDEKAVPMPPVPAPNALLLGLSVERYLLRALKAIRSGELEEALLVLPFAYVQKLFRFLNDILIQNLDIEMVARCVFFLLGVHQNQIVATNSLVPLIDSFQRNLRPKLQLYKDRVGFNMAAMRYVQREIEHSSIKFFPEPILKPVQATPEEDAKNNKRKERVGF
eukprot:GILK01005231.1.p1 GENE.GILK01005231.1~~GILK01005231.1.p1  ORF type:complete len:974 (+),score=234.40 GILK01005231.1:60-2981(+)